MTNSDMTQYAGAGGKLSRFNCAADVCVCVSRDTRRHSANRQQIEYIGSQRPAWPIEELILCTRHPQMQRNI